MSVVTSRNAAIAAAPVGLAALAHYASAMLPTPRTESWRSRKARAVAPAVVLGSVDVHAFP